MVPAVKLRWPVAVFLFAPGAVASLVGDHSHIVTGTTDTSAAELASKSDIRARVTVSQNDFGRAVNEAMWEFN